MVEEEMQRSIQQDLPIDSVEMMRENAAVLFEHHQLDKMASDIDQYASNLVELIRMDDFYGICAKPHLFSTKALGVVKLDKQEDGGIVRIDGVCRSTKKELKAYLKNFDTFRPHTEIGQEMELFFLDSGGCLWAPGGELIRERLTQWWKSFHRALGFSIIGRTGSPITKPASCSFARQFAEIGQQSRKDRPSGEGGLFDLACYTSDEFWWEMDEENGVRLTNSYLHFIKKTVNIIPIDCTWIFYRNKVKSSRSRNNRDLSADILSKALEMSGIDVENRDGPHLKYPTLEVRFIDALGREWPGPKVEIRQNVDDQAVDTNYPYVLCGTLFGSLERMVAILLESTKGQLPFWLAPEQVRILPVKSEDHAYAKEIAKEITEKGYRVNCDNGPGTLSDKVYAANRCKVPYVVFIGKKEREKRAVAVKCCSKENETSVVSFELFMEELHKQSEKTQIPY